MDNEYFVTRFFAVFTAGWQRLILWGGVMIFQACTCSIFKILPILEFEGRDPRVARALFRVGDLYFRSSRCKYHDRHAFPKLCCKDYQVFRPDFLCGSMCPLIHVMPFLCVRTLSCMFFDRLSITISTPRPGPLRDGSRIEFGGGRSRDYSKELP
mgnify:CR=1 FL=1